MNDHDLAALYVVDALTPDETAEFEIHLADCVACQEEVADMRGVTEQLSRSVAADPPASLRASVLAEIGAIAQEQPAPSAPDNVVSIAQEQPAPSAPDNVVSLAGRRPSRLPYLVAAASVLLALGFGGWALQSRNDAQQASAQQAQIEQLLGSPDVQAVTAEAAGGGSGTVVLSHDSGKAVFVSSGMADLPDDKVYELWTIAKTPVSAGTFTSSGATTLVKLPPAALDADTIAVTVEPAGGSAQPTTDPVIALTLA